jgi:hypothetical protein
MCSGDVQLIPMAALGLFIENALHSRNALSIADVFAIFALKQNHADVFGNSAVSSDQGSGFDQAWDGLAS